MGTLPISCNSQNFIKTAEMDAAFPSTAYPISTPTYARTNLSTSYPINVGAEIMEPTLGDLVIPTPGASSGLVTGILKDIATDDKLVNQTIFLGDVIYPSIGTGFSVGIDQSLSPSTITNYQGEFYLNNVKPGEYVIMAWTPFQSSLVLDPKTNEPMVILVQPNTHLDLGLIEVINPNR